MYQRYFLRIDLRRINHNGLQIYYRAPPPKSRYVSAEKSRVLTRLYFILIMYRKRPPMYLGAPDRCVWYGDRSVVEPGPEPSNERPSAASCAYRPPLFMGIIRFTSERSKSCGWISKKRMRKSRGKRYTHSHTLDIRESKFKYGL